MRAPPQKTNGLLFDYQWCLISSSRLVYDIMAALRGRCQLFFWWVFIEFTRGTHEEKRSHLQWMNEWMNEEPRMRGQQTCLLTIHFNMWTVSSDVSIQRHHWQPLSVIYELTVPTHPMMWMIWCVKVDPTTGVYVPYSFANSGVGSFMSHKNQISVSAVRRDLWFFVLIRPPTQQTGAFPTEPTTWWLKALVFHFLSSMTVCRIPPALGN